jgi:hypothetical protein
LKLLSTNHQYLNTIRHVGTQQQPLYQNHGIHSMNGSWHHPSADMEVLGTINKDLSIH